MAHSEAVWVDSDVTLDWLGNRQPWDVSATALFEGAVLGHWELWFSPLTLANVFYIYRKQVGTLKALNTIKSIVRISKVAGMDATHVALAIGSGRNDFEDELQIACANDVPELSAIITRNVSDYAHNALPAMTADSWMAQHPLP